MPFALDLDIGYGNLKMAFGDLPADDTAPCAPETARVLPAGAGHLSDLPIRMGRQDGDADALVEGIATSVS